MGQLALVSRVLLPLFLDLSAQFSPTESLQLFNFFMELNKLSVIWALKFSDEAEYQI